MYGLRVRFLSRHVFLRRFKALAPRKTDVCDFLSACDIAGGGQRVYIDIMCVCMDAADCWRR